MVSRSGLLTLHSVLYTLSVLFEVPRDERGPVRADSDGARAGSERRGVRRTVREIR